jgi:fructoselysine-6-P-deglycase FrlB-like protein
MSHVTMETAYSPEAVARFLDRNPKTLGAIGARLRKNPPPVMITSARDCSNHAAYIYLPFERTSNPFLDPISLIQTVYRIVEATAEAKDPNRPRLLKKVTETV